MEENEHNNTALRLQELSDSDFEIADDQPNILNWSIVDSSGEEVGEVEDLIFDLESRQVLYIVALIDTEHDDSVARVLVPIGVVDFDESEDEVIVSQQVTELVPTLPEYEPGTVVSPAEELAIRYAFLGEQALTDDFRNDYVSHPEDFYRHHHFDNDKFKKRKI